MLVSSPVLAQLKKVKCKGKLLYLHNLLQEVGRLRKVFEESFFLINPDGVLPVGVIFFNL